MAADINHLAEPNANWLAKPSNEEMSQVEELLRIMRQVRENLDGVGVAINFICRRIQPSKERVNPTYEYAGDDNIAREVPKKV